MTIESEVIDAIGSLIDGRVYADQAPSSIALPFIVFLRSPHAVTYQLNGIRNLGRVNVDVQVWSKSRDEAESIASAAIAALEAYTSPTVQKVTQTGRFSSRDLELEI